MKIHIMCIFVLVYLDVEIEMKITFQELKKPLQRLFVCFLLCASPPPHSLLRSEGQMQYIPLDLLIHM